MTPLLQLDGLTKSYGALAVTRDVTLAVQPGEVHALIGPNGAGKTTLVGQIAGSLRPDRGRIVFGGHDVTALAAAPPRPARSRALVPDHHAAAGVHRARERGRSPCSAPRPAPFRFLRDAGRRARAERRADAALASVGARRPRDTAAAGAQPWREAPPRARRRAGLRPRCCCWTSRWPASATDEAARLLSLLQALRGQFAMLLVEHDMDAVFALSDRVSVLVDGAVIASGPPAAIRADPAVRAAYLGDDAMLSVTGLQAGYGGAQVLFGVDLTSPTARPCRCSAATAWARPRPCAPSWACCARWPARSASDGEDAHRRQPDPHRPRRAGPGAGGRQIFPRLTVEENLLACAASRHGAARWTLTGIYALFPRLQERRRICGWQLSGGEQQMLAIGRALMTNPRLLILDEATEGLAPLIRAEIWDCLHTLKQEGMAMLVIDKSLDALLRLADRHAVIERGRIVWTGAGEALIAERATVEQALHV